MIFQLLPYYVIILLKSTRRSDSDQVFKTVLHSLLTVLHWETKEYFGSSPKDDILVAAIFKV